MITEENTTKSERTLTIKEVANLLNLSYSTVFAHRFKWGFFKWKVRKRGEFLGKILTVVGKEKIMSSDWLD